MSIRRRKHPDLNERVAASEAAARDAHATAAVARRTLDENNLAIIVNTALGMRPREQRGKS